MANPKPLRRFQVLFKPDMDEQPPRTISEWVDAERFWVTPAGQVLFFIEDRAIIAYPRFKKVLEVGLVPDLMKPSAT